MNITSATITDTLTGEAVTVPVSTVTFYRVYPDGEVIHQDDFAEVDQSRPVHDDFGIYPVPDGLDYRGVMALKHLPVALIEHLLEEINELGDI